MGAFKFKFTGGTQPISVEDWQKRAIRKLPDLALSYFEGGADDLTTMRENMSSFRAWRLRQRVLTGVSNPDMTATVANTQVSMPVALAPVGAMGLGHYTGDCAAARAAESCGTRMVLSTASSYNLEEVGEATQENHFFQLYPIGGRERIAKLLERARAAGFTALFVTVDVMTIGNREGERRWNFVLPWTVTPSRALHLLPHWKWIYRTLKHKRIASSHYLEMAKEVAQEEQDAAGGLGKGIADAVVSKETMAKLMMGELNWDDIAFIRDNWKGPLYIKGILDPDDAEQAVDRIGADGVVVSNHGGRQLDRSLASIDALSPIVERIGDRAEVYLDGGVRRGTDVITALCLGARGVFIGRPFLYGLISEGESGVRSVLEIFREEIKRDLILMGCPSIAVLDRSWLIRADQP
ncbi:MAG: alpha-hydroxy acid oxidase [Novosphingobium sp.]|nr:alpha-hydroxy acid oxidase [Novosphingobium sp.]